MGKSLAEEAEEYARRSSPEYVKTTLDTMNALTWPGPGTYMGRDDRENLVRARMQKMDRGSPARHEVLALADSLYKNYEKEYEDYHRAEEAGQRMPHKFPSWKTPGRGTQIQAQADAFTEIDRRRMGSFGPAVHTLNGQQQMALQQNGMVWLNGKQWVRDPSDPDRLMILEY